MSAGENLRELPAHCDVVVVGGGIAGLAAAWALRDRDVVLLEAEQRVGGRIRSEPRGDYWLNLAAHLFPPPDSNLGRLVSELGLETVLIPGAAMAVSLNGRVSVGGAAVTYPARLRTPLAGRVSLARAGLRIRRAVREYSALARARPGDTPAAVRRRLLEHRDDRSFAEFLGPLHADADALLRAAINRVSAEPEVLAAGAGVAQFAATFSGSSSHFQRNLPGGSSVLTERLHEALGRRVVLGAAVGAVTDTQRQHQGAPAPRWSGPRDPRRRAVVAVPAFVARRIVPQLGAAQAAALDAVRYGPYVVAALLTGERRPMPWDRIYALVAARRSFNMLFNTASTLRGGPQRRPGGSLTVYGAATLAQRLGERSDDDVTDTFLADLYDVFPDARGIVGEVVIQRWERGIPFSAPGRGAHQRQLEAPLGPIHFAGDHLGERGGMDTAATSGVEAAAAIRSLLARRLPGRDPPDDDRSAHQRAPRADAGIPVEPAQPTTTQRVPAR